MAKKLEKVAQEVVEEVKGIELELAAKLKSAFHTVCTKFGNVEFVDGKATVSSDKKELIEELQNLNVINNPEKPPETESPATTETSGPSGQ